MPSSARVVAREPREWYERQPKLIQIRQLLCMEIKLCTSLVTIVAFFSSPFAICSEPAAETWSAKSPLQWPQMVLTNSAHFRGHTALNGASAFLLRAPNGEIFGATALHLLGENGGVEPTITSDRLNDVLEEWLLFPRTKSDETVHVEGLGPMPKPTIKQHADWLILRIDQKNIPAQILPLQARKTPVEIGETVFLIGVSYAEPKVAQKVYTGKVTERAPGGRFRFDIEPHVDIRGFSGAPVVDRNGFAVGVTSIWFSPKMDGELYMESGAEDASTIVHVLNDIPDPGRNP